MGRQVFGKYGQIHTIKNLLGNSTNGACIISFSTVEEAQALVNMNGKTPDGLDKPIKATFKAQKSGFGKGDSNFTPIGKGGGGGGGGWNGGGGGGWGAPY